MTLRGAEGWLSLFSMPGDDVSRKLELLSLLGAAVAFPFSFLGEDAVLLLLLFGDDAVFLFFSVLSEIATSTTLAVPFFPSTDDDVTREPTLVSLVVRRDVLSFLSWLDDVNSGGGELSFFFVSVVSTKLPLASLL